MVLLAYTVQIYDKFFALTGDSPFLGDVPQRAIQCFFDKAACTTAVTATARTCIA